MTGQCKVRSLATMLQYTSTSMPPRTKPQRVWNIPYLRNDYFTGREDILAQLHARFKANNATALSQRTAMSGLGGIGKTQIAVQYAYEHCDEYQVVLWARAESHEALTSSFVEIASTRYLNLPQKDEKDQTLIVDAVKHWLQDNHGWLLILDNADEPAIVRNFLPTKCAGHILLTTRAQALGGLAQRIDVDTFTPELGALFLLRRATLIAADGAIDDAVQGDREVATKISEELGGLALALDQAGAYIEETACSLSDYLKRYCTRRAAMLKRRGENAHDYPASVATTWSLSFEQVKKRSAAAADLLQLCAFLAPDAIPEEIVTKEASYLEEHLQGVMEEEGLLDEAIGTLRACSLIRRDATEKTLSIHRLVQTVLRDAMDEQNQQQWTKRVIQAVNKACPAVEFVMWQQWERYLPHALVCADLVEQENLIFAKAARLLNQAGYYLDDRARYSEAEPLLLRALQIREQQLGPEHPETATRLGNLALLYDSQGKDEQAEPLYVRALAILEQSLGSQHPHTQQTRQNYAILLRAMGRDEEAKHIEEGNES